MNSTRQPGLLADHGASTYRIVLPHRASPSQHHAAEELQRHIKEISGAHLPIVDDRRPAQPCEIVLGNSKRLEALKVRVDWKKLGDEGCLLRTVGRTLVIAGSAGRGTLYGVYGLLEEAWGCRWFTPAVSRIPRQVQLALPKLHRTWIPKLEYRESYWTEGWDADWAARNRQNSSHARLEREHGGKIVYEGFVHTMTRWVPDTLHARHPEYFALRRGKRLPGLAQRCLTHPDVLRITIANVRKALRAHPEANIVSVSQNDNQDFCECDRCRALDAREGSHAGTMLTFVNRVAQAIEREFPKVAVDTLAYQYTRKPPKTVRPRPNVIVRLCTIECCFSHPLDGCPEVTNTSLVRDLKGWSRLTRRLYVWDYVTDFVHYLLPFPDLDVLDTNIRTFVRYGVVGLFEQGNYSKGGGGAQADLKAWVIAQLLVNPALDVDALIREFIAGVYGPAAPSVQAATDLGRAAIRRSREHVRIFDGPDRGYLDPQVLRGCDLHLDRAERIARRIHDAALVSRIERLRMSIWYTQAAQAAERPKVLARAAKRLRAAIVHQHLSNLTEWRPLKADFSRLDLAPRRRKVVPAVRGTIVAEDFLFNLWGGKTLPLLVADAGAGDGVAARQPGETTWGSFQWDLPERGKRGVRYLVRARIRVEKKGHDGPGFTVGVYELPSYNAVGEVRVSAGQIPDSGYHWYNLCTVTLRPNLYANVTPGGNAAAVGAVYTDRFELVPVRSRRRPESRIR